MGTVNMENDEKKELLKQQIDNAVHGLCPNFQPQKNWREAVRLSISKSVNTSIARVNYKTNRITTSFNLDQTAQAEMILFIAAHNYYDIDGAKETLKYMAQSNVSDSSAGWKTLYPALGLVPVILILSFGKIAELYESGFPIFFCIAAIALLIMIVMIFNAPYKAASKAWLGLGIAPGLTFNSLMQICSILSDKKKWKYVSKKWIIILSLIIIACIAVEIVRSTTKETTIADTGSQILSEDSQTEARGTENEVDEKNSEMAESSITDSASDEQKENDERSSLVDSSNVKLNGEDAAEDLTEEDSALKAAQLYVKYVKGIDYESLVKQLVYDGYDREIAITAAEKCLPSE